MLAVVLEGRSEVRIGSKIAKSGIITLDETPFFSLFDKVIIEIGVTSDPVPAVVGVQVPGSFFGYGTALIPSWSIHLLACHVSIHRPGWICSRSDVRSWNLATCAILRKVILSVRTGLWRC